MVYSTTSLHSAIHGSKDGAILLAIKCRSDMLLSQTIKPNGLLNISDISARWDVSSLSLADWVAIARTMGYEPIWAYKMFCSESDPQKYNLAVVSRTTWSKIAQVFQQSETWAEIQYLKWSALKN